MTSFQAFQNKLSDDYHQLHLYRLYVHIFENLLNVFLLDAFVDAQQAVLAQLAHCALFCQRLSGGIFGAGALLRRVYTAIFADMNGE